ncbi:N-6 DNA methylase [Streptomyces sp. VRA16 Mangrove soil]|uniref:N-6 DNA methylase n=1 Tax=Streptomyces sp. VRA16 Mangrove soil TaxID=2817434 RepID=UPI001A9E0A17|nr:N-6 DNA methylase [Streptomyces sp. VRA16 Mangrove soil]MBO1336569.1 N-6 DNA methylase [Streptomyces sp. VRA16 Mangrove soil]
MQDNATEVTAAGIARLAGVGRAAVSNWRRRHADFPKPVGGTETSPSFALTEVEGWLRAQGKLAEVPLRERVWQQLAGHPAGPVTALLHAGSVLLLVHDRPTEWLVLSASADDDGLAGRLSAALEGVLTPRFGPPAERALATPTAAALVPSVPLLRGVADLAAELGARRAFAFLLGRHLDANPRQYTLTPPGPAALMAALAGPAATFLDPACGTGALLHAVRTDGARSEQRLYGQDAAPELAALTALRLALDGPARDGEGPVIRTAAADTLRGDALSDVQADVVLAHPPFNERGWGHDELAYDPRWEYGFPARTESELAWVQHALARLRDGGTAVLLMPPTVASRRSGRRIRADLLRRGALRAVVALPAGAVPPNNIPLHLWILRRPTGSPAAPELLLVDTTSLAAPGDVREKQAWAAVQDAVLDAWRTFDRAGTLKERPGVARSVPVIELLDDEVDLAPARRLPPPAAGGGGAAELTAVRENLADTLRLTTRLAPAPAAPAAEPARWPLTTIGELARAGALLMRTAATTGADSRTGDHARVPVPVLTDHDVLTGAAPSGTFTGDDEPFLLAAGDVVVPVVGGGATARVVDEATAGAALGRGLALLRPDPAALDSWFLAGFLRSTANNRQASSYASTATRLDVRRLQLPRLPLPEQAGYGDRFRALAAFEDALRSAARLGEQLVQGLHDGLTDGTLAPR